jgi:lipopolysaccharide export system protein LptC
MSRAIISRIFGTAAAPATPGIGAREAAIRRAQRHSRRVRILRIGLPAIAAVGLLLFGLLILLDPARLLHGFPVEFTRISISGDKLTIEAPRLTGFTRDARPYSVTAQSAVQDLKQPNLVELTGIVGEVVQDSGASDLRATNGLYDMKAEQMRLSGGIQIRATGGYRITLSDAFVEIRKGEIATDNPVHAIFPDGSLQASRLRVFDHGAHLVFDGGVNMTFRLPPPDDPDSDGTQQ